MKYSIAIYNANVKRIGWLRTNAGLLAMIACIPALILIYFTCVILLFRWFLFPLFKLQKPPQKHHFVNNRHKQVNLPPIDSFNCQFCAYANGLCTLMNAQLDCIAHVKKDNILSTLAYIIHIPILLCAEISIQIIYNGLVATILGLHRTSHKEVYDKLMKKKYAQNLNSINKLVFRYHKSQWLRFSYALEQIESSWCPLLHYEQEHNIVRPPHHKRFFTHKETQTLQNILNTTGTVSPKKPKY